MGRTFPKALLCLLLAPLLASAQPAVKDNATGERRSKEGWFICETKRPSVQLVLPRVSNTDGCTGTAKIQGIMWRCGSIDEVTSTTRHFYDGLVSRARARCEEHCKKRTKHCHGRFIAPDYCKFYVKTDMAKHMGSRVGCHDKCDGNALSYCSLYHSSLLSVDKELLKKENANCFCVKDAESDSLLDKLKSIF